MPVKMVRQTLTEDALESMREVLSNKQDHVYIALHDSEGNQTSPRKRLDKEDMEQCPHAPILDQNTKEIRFSEDELTGGFAALEVFHFKEGGMPVIHFDLSEAQENPGPGTVCIIRPGDLCLMLFPRSQHSEICL